MRKPFKGRDARISPRFLCVVISLLTFCILTVTIFLSLTPETVDIKVGSPSPQLIKATKDIVDTVTTQALLDDAAAQVEPSYKSIDPSITETVIQELDGAFIALRDAVSEYTPESLAALSDEEITALSETLPVPLERDQLVALTGATDSEYNAMVADTIELAQSALDSSVPEGTEQAVIRNIDGAILQDHPAKLADLSNAVMTVYFHPNMLIDEEITEANREKAREGIVPVIRVKDEVIVREGDIVTLAQYTMIESMGILSDNTMDVSMLAGIAMLILLIMGAFGFYLYNFCPDQLMNPKKLLLLCLIMVVSVSCSILGRTVNNYFVPVALAYLLTLVLVDVRISLFMNLTVSLLTALLGLSASGMFSLVLLSSISAPLTCRFYAHRSGRMSTLFAGMILALINLVGMLAFGLFNSTEMDTVLLNAAWSSGGCLVAATLCVALQPIFENTFNIATQAKLIELSNPNHPLLRRLLIEASGTYHHSILVANLAEAGCNAIGANALLARVAAYYHDIGKLKRPMYFKENQVGENPHDHTDPRVSTAMLTAHTRDGAQMAQKYRIPEAIVDIIRQHHGDTPVMFFYDKAMKMTDGNADISAFRYDGPRPQTREAAVVMLADTIEAATRAMKSPTSEKVDELIRKLVNGKLSDGQLDSCALTFSDIDKICGAFSTVLTGMFHQRIEYPDTPIPTRTGAAENTAPAQTAEASAAAVAETAATPVAEPAAESAPSKVCEASPAAQTRSTIAQDEVAAPVKPSETDCVKPAVAAADTTVVPIEKPVEEVIITEKPRIISAGIPVPPVRPDVDREDIQ